VINFQHLMQQWAAFFHLKASYCKGDRGGRSMARSPVTTIMAGSQRHVRPCDGLAFRELVLRRLVQLHACLVDDLPPARDFC
jgi:hypothetical protein